MEASDTDKPMRSGRLRHRVTIQRPVVTQNEYGEGTIQWEDEDDIWCSVEAIAGRELLNNDRVQSEITHRVNIRFRSTLTSDRRLVHNGQVLEIERIGDPTGRMAMQELLCKVTDGGTD